MRRQRLEHRLELPLGDEAFTRVARIRGLDNRSRDDATCFDGQCERAPERRELLIDGGPCRARLEPLGLIGAYPVGRDCQRTPAATIRHGAIVGLGHGHVEGVTDMLELWP